MTAQEYRAICNALISNHHKKMLEAAKLGNDTKTVALLTKSK